MKVALCVGHSRIVNTGQVPGEAGSTNDGGAIAVDGVTREWDFWRCVAGLTKRRLPAYRHDVSVYDVYEGDNYSSSMDYIARQIRNARADLAIELHFNAYNGEAQGREAFYWHNSKRGKEFAEILLGVQGRLSKEGGGEFPNRGAKPATAQNRGGQFLQKTHCPAIIWEGFFGDNAEEWAWHHIQEALLAEILAQSFEEWEPYQI